MKFRTLQGVHFGEAVSGSAANTEGRGSGSRLTGLLTKTHISPFLFRPSVRTGALGYGILVTGKYKIQIASLLPGRRYSDISYLKKHLANIRQVLQSVKKPYKSPRILYNRGNGGVILAVFFPYYTTTPTFA